MKQLYTKWGEEKIEDDIPLKEYPRPILERNSYYNLNGEWECEISKNEKIYEYTQKIQVPFAPETKLSGVEHIVKPDEYLHYRKKFKVNKNFIENRVFLHIGAVDQECELFLNGNKIGENVGGYIPFTLEITNEILIGENTLEIKVVDKTEYSHHARGKQKLYPKGDYSSLFYTPVSGIWKSVWLESVPSNFIENIKITPNIDTKSINLNIKTNTNVSSAKVSIYFGGQLIQKNIIETNKNVSVLLNKLYLWSPESPNLYDIVINYEKDTAISYFGMRKYSIEKDKEGILRFHLNNEPYYFNGVLDQGYWPESLLTPPADEALIYDIKKMKRLGFNTIRKHVKIETERFYFHCDKIGMIVWQDMPNGGGEYNHEFVTDLPNESDLLARNIPDDKYTMFKREDAKGRKQYYKDLQNMIETLYNYPSIAMWIPFNEGWGQFDAKKATDITKKLDPARFIMETSGWFDQGGGDTFSIHNYRHKLSVSPKENRVVVLSEFGGYSRAVKNHQSHEKEFGYQNYDTKEKLTINYKRLWNEDILSNIENGLSATIYTQLSDVEEEINGLLTYDRKIDKVDSSVIKAINTDIQKKFTRIT